MQNNIIIGAGPSQRPPAPSNSYHATGNTTRTEPSQNRKASVIGNPSQNKAIHHESGPCLVLAGPGSGKTFVLVQHILHLIQNVHVPPEQILVITFSKASAIEMQSRYLKELHKQTDQYDTKQDATDGYATSNAPSQMVAESESVPSPIPVLKSPMFGTFHAIFFQIVKSAVKSNVGNLSHYKTIRLLDAKTKNGLLHRLYRQYITPNPTDTGTIDPNELNLLAGDITRQKTSLAKWEHQFPHPEVFPQIYRDYTQFLRENGLLDFDDIICTCYRVLQNNPVFLSKWQERLQHILIDEFQDISPMQLRVIKLLAGDRANIFAVGDDDQSIYAFRGATPSVMRQFLTDYPNGAKIDLEVNYRCTAAILQKANLVIKQNKSRLPKTVTANKSGGAPVIIETVSGSAEQADFLVTQIKTLMEKGRSASDIAIITRTNHQIPGFQHALEAAGIPVDAKKAVQRTDPSAIEVRMIIRSYYHLMEQLKEGRSVKRSDFYRVMNVPQRYLLRSLCQNEKESADLLIKRAGGKSPTGQCLVDLFNDLWFLRTLRPAKSLAYLLDQMGVREALAEGKTEAQQASVQAELERIEALSEANTDFYSFFAALEQKTERSAMQCSAKMGATQINGVHLLTMHACKGLEFPTVILPDLNEGVIPPRKSSTEEAIEEERRLLYVAMTRAKEELLMCCIVGTQQSPRRPSRFLLPLGVRAPWEL